MILKFLKTNFIEIY